MDKKLLDPKVDSTFKTLFTKDGQESKIALKGLVKAITGLTPEDIIVVSNELATEVVYAKDIRLDLRCRLPDGE